MTIEIIETEFTINDDNEFWAVWLEISQLGTNWLLPATAPGNLLEADLQAHFDTREAELWVVAQQKAILPNAVYERIVSGRIAKAFALVVLDEVNLLRAQHGLSARTAEQLRTALKAKLKG